MNENKSIKDIVLDPENPILLDLEGFTLNEEKEICEKANGASMALIGGTGPNQKLLVQGLIWIFGRKRHPDFTWEMAGDALPIHYDWYFVKGENGEDLLPLEGITHNLQKTAKWVDEGEAVPVAVDMNSTSSF